MRFRLSIVALPVSCFLSKLWQILKKDIKKRILQELIFISFLCILDYSPLLDPMLI